MAVMYVLACLYIIIINFSFVDEAFGMIVGQAFAPSAAVGGFIGVLIQGFRRAAFSNEAGLGSAPIAHSAVKTNYPITEGFVSLLEPFLDTVIICTMTALVLVITGMYINVEGYGGIQLTSSAFESVLPWFPYVLALAAILFAFSTMIAWSYYGLKSWTYLLGEGEETENVFKFIFCGFVVIGSSMSLGPVIDISDSMIFAMSIFNLMGVYFLASIVKKDLQEYLRLRSSK